MWYQIVFYPCSLNWTRLTVWQFGGSIIMLVAVYRSWDDHMMKYGMLSTSSVIVRACSRLTTSSSYRTNGIRKPGPVFKTTFSRTPATTIRLGNDTGWAWCLRHSNRVVCRRYGRGTARWACHYLLSLVHFSSFFCYVSHKNQLLVPLSTNSNRQCTLHTHVTYW